MRAVNPALAVWLKNFNALVQKLVAAGFKANPTNAREGLAGLTRNYVTKIPDIAWVQDDYVNAPEYNVPVRIYHPAPEKELPVLIYYHGGGHMSGSVSVYDPICRKLAKVTNHIVVAPEYRLAPENPYPAGITDALAVAKYLWQTLDGRSLRYTRELSIGGDSAGGALSSTVAARAQYESDISIKRQILIYPSLDYTMNFPSMEENAVGYLLQKEKIIWYFNSYFTKGEDRKAASPLYWDIEGKMPETLIFTAEFCPLKDEGEAYVAKLRKAKIPVEHIHFDDMIHTFVNLEDLVPEACERLYKAIGIFMNR